MPLEYPLVHIDDVEPENMDAGQGWSITDFRLPISKRQGSSTTMFRARFMPGAIHKKHRHENCDEIYYIISGHGLAGAGPDRVEVRGGHYHYIPRGVEHWMYNLSETEPIEAVGIYDRAGSVEESGYVYTGEITEADLAMPRAARPDQLKYPLVHDDDVVPENVSKDQGWTQDRFCQPISRKHGSPTTWMFGYFMPGQIHKKHRHDKADEICFILKGHGLAGVGPDRVEVREGHFHFIPKGTEHWLANLSETEPLIAPGVYVGAGGLDESGFVYTGDVTEEDIKQRTA